MILENPGSEHGESGGLIALEHVPIAPEVKIHLLCKVPCVNLASDITLSPTRGRLHLPFKAGAHVPIVRILATSARISYPEELAFL